MSLFPQKEVTRSDFARKGPRVTLPDMVAIPNSTWGGVVSGEWWLTEDGEAWYADQDIGDQGHETIALDHMLDRDVIVEGLEALGEIGPEEVDDEMAGGAYFYFNTGIPDKVGKEAAGAEVWKTIETMGPREAFMKHYGAIMVIGDSFMAWRVTEKTIRSIQEFILEQTDGEPNSDLEITIERVEPSKRYVVIEWADFQFAKKPRDLLWE